jgi:nitrogen fixation NifU-like protein
MHGTNQERYGPVFLDHFHRPRNVGTLEDPDVHVRVSNPVCGDVLDLYLDWDGDRIGLIRYRVFGCPAAVAAASCLSETVRGSTRAEAAGLGPERLIEILGGLPRTKRHGASLAAEGLKQLLKKSP